MSNINLVFNSLSTSEIDNTAFNLNEILTSSFHVACPVSKRKFVKDTPWWNTMLAKLRKKCRRLYNRAEHTRLSVDWNNYNDNLKIYKKEIRKSKRKAWRNFCEEVEGVPETSRIHKILSKNSDSVPGSFEVQPGLYTNSQEESLIHLLNSHFPENTITTVDQSNGIIDTSPSDEDWSLARQIVTPDKLKWSVFSFSAYKSPGNDGIFPIIIHQSFPFIHYLLLVLCQSCIAYGYVPVAWRESRVTFIPKPGKSSYEDAKSFRPICLSSIFLKVVERMIDWYIRDDCLKQFPLHTCQHAYQKGRSVETILHNVVAKIEKSLSQNEYTLGIFVDIEGAFDKTSINTIEEAAVEHGVSNTISKFISFMLKNRVIVAKLGETQVKISTTKGCPQGGVLSPLLWCLVIDSLLIKLNSSGYASLAYADDVTILIRGKFCDIISEQSQIALNIVQEWCVSRSLGINASKSDTVLFTRKRLTPGLADVHIFGSTIKRSNYVKYLGVILDNKLTWQKHLEFKTEKAISIFWQCRNAFGKTWGLNPKSIFWIYSAVVRPTFSFAAVVWWPRLKFQKTLVEMTKLQRMPLLAISGSMRTTPTAAIQFLLNIPPLHIFVEKTARRTAYRLRNISEWQITGSNSGHKEILSRVMEDPVFMMPCDTIKPFLFLNKNFEIIESSRDDWTSNDAIFPFADAVFCYTDGSLKDGRAGVGIFCSDPNISLSIPLGRFCTIYMAEVYALLLCIKKVLNINVNSKTIYLCSDSQSAIKSLSGPVVASSLVKECRIALVELGRNNKINIVWVPGHAGVDGNERADELANIGSDAEFIGPEPALGIPFSILYNNIEKWCSNAHFNYWINTPGFLQTKNLKSLITQISRESFGFLTGNN